MQRDIGPLERPRLVGDGAAPKPSHAQQAAHERAGRVVEMVPGKGCSEVKGAT